MTLAPLMRALLCASVLIPAGHASAAPLSERDRSELIRGVDARGPELTDAAMKISGLCRDGYRETKSSALLQDQLKAAGFTVTPGVAGMPTAFIASFKNGDGPVVAVLAEFDALPGLAQAASARRGRRSPARKPVTAAGTTCSARPRSTARSRSRPGWSPTTSRANCGSMARPPKKAARRKVYMVRDGLLNDVDIAIHWHPGNENSAAQTASKANLSGKFRFHGVSSHASGAPEKGLSALDGVEIMEPPPTSCANTSRTAPASTTSSPTAARPRTSSPTSRRSTTTSATTTRRSCSRSGRG